MKFLNPIKVIRGGTCHLCDNQMATTYHWNNKCSLPVGTSSNIQDSRCFSCFPPRTLPSFSNSRTTTCGIIVDQILDSRYRRRQLQYLVLWKGYPISDATWEPVTHLQNALETIRDFHQLYPHKPAASPGRRP